MAIILLIDDDADLVEANRLVLAKRGHRVQAAYSAGEARTALAAARPDVVVLDIMMESESAGIELARDIQQTHPGLPTIILSSIHRTKKLPFRFAPDEEWLPVLKVLDKPVDPSALADEVEEILKKP